MTQPAQRIGAVADLGALQAEVEDLIRRFHHQPHQIGLTFPRGTPTEEQSVVGVGSLWGTTRREADFCEWVDGTTQIREALRSFGLPAIGRVRIMWMSGRRCYSVHRDPTRRVHIPIVTNPQALMIWPEVPFVLHMPADGGVWMTDTTLPHTAMNGSMEDRLHIVAALAEDD